MYEVCRCDSAKQVIMDWTEKIYKKLENYRKENKAVSAGGEEKTKSSIKLWIG